MARKLRIVAVGVVATLAIIVTALGAAYSAMQRVRPFYVQAMQVEPRILDAGRRELESRATALYSDTQQPGQWQATFTTAQINGWLAVQFPADADEADGEILAPRIAIGDGTLTLGFRTQRSGIETVVSVDAAVFLTEAGDVAVRILSVRAGALPVPVLHVAEVIAATCRELSLPVRWTQQKGQPVALIDVQQKAAEHGPQLYVDSVELHDGSLFVAGHTETDQSEPDLTTGPDLGIQETLDD